ncbi:MAG: ATP-binding protein [Bacteroidales bacterium]|nr:ATP-binding protein [Bacteroidales bacterium]
MGNCSINNSVELTSDLQNISIVEKLINNQAVACKLNTEVYGKLLIAVVEALNNAIVHGNNMDKDKKVKVAFEIDSEKIEYTISNEGESFDPESVPDPTSPENLENEGGRGVFLIKNLADEVHYSDEGRTVTMRFNLH